MATPPDDSQRRRPAAATPAALDGPLFRALFADASTLLHRHTDALNAINVFPVPDGDTGTNMHLTLRAGLDALEQELETSLLAGARALAHGSLMGARGNSGVILSQILRGLAAGLGDRTSADGAALAGALRSASDAAYAALAEPAEGTILTVIREAAESVAAAPKSFEETLATAAGAAFRAVERTPELLPALKEAGVVDAGGLGLAVILEGLLRSLRNDTVDVDLAPDAPQAPGWRSEAASLHHARHGESGYCTEFVVANVAAATDDIRERLTTLGGSVLVVGDTELTRVHVHTATPDDAIAYGHTLGDVTNVKVDNMDEQMQRFSAAGAAPAPYATAAAAAIVAVAAGDGLEAAFRSLGVTQLVRGGQTMNPSAGEILAAIDACQQNDVIVLPNNKNIIAASDQAAGESDKRVCVVPTRSIPQGIAAALALDPDLGLESNAEAMRDASAAVRSAEVTRAARATVVGGREIAVGQAIGIVDGELRVAAADVAAAAVDCVEEMLHPGASLLTVYYGADVRAEDTESLAAELRSRYAILELELVAGGQPHYPYLLSLE